MDRTGQRDVASPRRTGGLEEPFIALEKIQKIYRADDVEFLALSDVTLDIEAGELVSLVGPSGCGKSTLLRILAGIHPPDGGKMRLGSEQTPFNPSCDVGMVFQQPLLLRWRRILENVLLPIEVLDRPVAQYRGKALELLELVGLAGYANKYPYELSGGMQQRAAIARALIHDPRLILMDEPFGALDAITRERMNLELLRIWEASRKTIVLVTHSIPEAILLGSRCVVLTSSPARMADQFEIELPYPRTLDMRTHEAFGAYARRAYSLLGLH